MGIARPNSSQAVETTECAAKCDQGDGSAEDTKKYSDCVQSCIASLFPSSQTGSQIPGAAASSGAVTRSGTAAANPTAGTLISTEMVLLRLTSTQAHPALAPPSARLAPLLPRPPVLLTRSLLALAVLVSLVSSLSSPCKFGVGRQLADDSSTSYK